MPAKKSVVETVRLGILRSDVKSIQVLDTDMVILLKNGRKLFVRDGAVRAMMDPEFRLLFLDQEVTGQEILQNTGNLEFTPLSTTTSVESGDTNATSSSAPTTVGPVLIGTDQSNIGNTNTNTNISSPVKTTGWSFLDNLPPSIGALGALGVIGIAGSGGSTAAAVPATSAVLSGSVVLGPTLSTNDFKIIAYDASGNQIGSATNISSDGSYSLVLQAGYRGVVILQLSDSGTNVDYVDESTGVGKSLGTNKIRAILYVDGTAAVANITPLTELAALKMQTNTTTAGNPIFTGAVGDITIYNKAIASTFKLSSTDEIITLTPKAVIDSKGNADTTANSYGAILAIISGAEMATGQSTTQVLSSLNSAITVDTKTATGVVGASATSLLQQGATQVASQVSAATSGSSVNVINNILNLSITDATPPVVTAVTDNVAASITNGPITFVVTLSEALGSNLGVANFAATNATVNTVSKVDDTHYDVSVTPSTNLASGAVALSIKSLGVVVDLSGNLLVNASLSSFDQQQVDTLAPTLLSFGTTTPSGRYRIGANIDITAKLSEVVQAGATVEITLDTGETLTLSNGATPNDTLTGTYVVPANKSSVGLTVSSYTITAASDTAGTAMTSTALPSDANNLGNYRIVIDPVVVDTQAPTVLSFGTTSDTGSYKVDSTLNLTATLSESVQAGASVEITLDTGERVTLTNGATAGNTLTGTYTVKAGNSSAELTVSSYTITSVSDAAGNAMTSTALPSTANNLGNSHIVIDTQAPTMLMNDKSTYLVAAKTTDLSTGLSLFGDGTGLAATDNQKIGTVRVKFENFKDTSEQILIGSNAYYLNGNALPTTTSALAGLTWNVSYDEGDFVFTTASGATSRQVLALFSALGYKNLLGASSTDGQRKLFFTLTDQAGNVQATPLEVDVQLSTTPPVALVSQFTALSNDTGTVGDFVTTVANQSVTGQFSDALRSGDTIQVSANGITWVNAAVIATNTWQANGLSLSGSGTLSARIVDSSGNTNSAGHATQTYSVVTTAPAATPTIASVTDAVSSGYAAGDGTGVIANGASTNDPKPVIAGTLANLSNSTLPAGQVLQVWDGTTLLGNATVTVTGSTTASWVFTPTTPLATGSHSFTAKWVDTASGLAQTSATYGVVENSLSTVSVSQANGWQASNSYLPVRYVMLRQGPTSTMTVFDGMEVTVMSNGVNVAKDKPVTTNMTFQSRFPVSRLTDGVIPSTRDSNVLAEGAGADGWIQIDLGAYYQVDSVTYINGYIPARSAGYHTIVSANDMRTATVSQLIAGFGGATVIGKVADNGSADSVTYAGPKGDSKAAATTVTTPTLSGVLGAPINTNSELLKVYENGVSVAGAMSVVGTQWTFTPTNDFTVGIHVLTVQLESSKGVEMAQQIVLNSSAASTPTETVTIDSVKTSAGQTYTTSSSVSIDDTKPTISGTLSTALGVNEVLAVYDNGQYLGNASNDGVSTAWSFVPSTALPNGTHSLTAKVVNTASGTSGAWSPDFSVIENSLSKLTVHNTTTGQTLQSSNSPLVRYVMFRHDPTTGNTTFDGTEVKVMSNNVNVALGKTVTTNATFSNSYPESRLTDDNNFPGNPQYLAEGAGPAGCWIQIDLGAYYQVDSVQYVDGWSNSDRTRGLYTFVSSTDMSTATVPQLLSGLNGTMTLGQKSKTVSATTVTYSGISAVQYFAASDVLSFSGTLDAALNSSVDQLAVYDVVGTTSTALAGTLTVNGTRWTFTPTASLSAGLHTLIVKVESTDGLKTARFASSQTFNIGAATAPTATATISSVSDSQSTNNTNGSYGSVFGDASGAFTASGSSTNDAALQLNGTLSAALGTGQSVQIYDGTTLLGNAVVNGTAWYFSGSSYALSMGHHSFTAQVALVQPLGNLATTSTPFDVNVNRITASITPRANYTLASSNLVRYVILRKDVAAAATWDVGDVQVYSNGVNVALGKTVATGSQTGFSNLSALVDGNSSSTMTATNAASTKAWVQVDLGGLYAVGSIVLLNTGGTPINMRSTYVYASAADMSGGVTNLAAATAPTGVSSFSFGSVSANFAAGQIANLSNAATMLRTADTLPVLSGQLAARLNPSVEVIGIYDSVNNGTTFSKIGTATVSGYAWSFTPTEALASGAHVLKAQIESTAGAVMRLAAQVNVTIGPVAVPTLSLSSVQDINATHGSTTGALGSGDTTDAAQPVLTGSLSAALAVYESVQVFDGSTPTPTFLGNATTNGTGWTYTPTTPLSAGAHTLTAYVVNAYSGNKGAGASFALNVQNAPTVVVHNGAGGTGTVVAHNGFTTDAQFSVTGTLSAPLKSNGVEVLGVYDNGNRLGTATLDGTGLNWTFTLPSLLATGGHTLQVQIEDPSNPGSTLGKAVGASFFTLTDSKTPTQTATLTSVVDDAATNGSVVGNVSNGTSTDDSTLTLSGAVVGSLPAGYAVVVYDGTTQLGTATVSGSTWKMTTAALSGGSHSFTAAVKNMGTDTLGPSSSSFSARVQSLSFDDTTKALSTKGYVADATPTLLGTLPVALNSGEWLAVYDNGEFLNAYQPVGTSWSITPTAELSTGSHILLVQVQNTASAALGSGRVVSDNISLVVDATDPTATVTLTSVVDAKGADQGRIEKSTLSDDFKPVLYGALSGTLSAGHGVAVYDGDNRLGYATVSNGQWSFTPTTPLAAGTHIFSVAVVNKASLALPTTRSDTWTIDSQSITWTGITDDVGAQTGNLFSALGSTVTTDDSTLTINGTLSHALATGQRLALYDGRQFVTAATFQADGVSWSFAPPVSALGLGTHSLSAQIENTSSPGVSLLRTSSVSLVEQTQDPVLALIDSYYGINITLPGQTLDLTALSNSTVVNTVNLQKAGTTLKLNLEDVLVAAHTDSITGLTGWSGSSIVTGAHQLVVNGVTGATVNAVDGTWSAAGTASYTSAGVTNTYAVYNHMSGSTVDAQLLINSDLTRAGAVL